MKPDFIGAAEAIQKLRLKPEMTIESLNRRFHALMKKHGIKWGREVTLASGAKATEGATPEYAALHAMYIDFVSRGFGFELFFRTMGVTSNKKAPPTKESK